MMTPEDIEPLRSWLLSLTEEQIVIATVCLWGGVFTLRSIITFLGRLFGLYSPNQYHLWPRLPWRPLYRAWLATKHWFEYVFLSGKRGGTGGFAGSLETFCCLFKPGLVLIGRAAAFGFGLLQPIGLNVSRHLFMLAMTGTGKTTSLITLLSTWRGSAFIIDPKSQIVDALNRHDKREFLAFDPDNISDVDSICMNFFDCIKDAMKRSGDDAAVLWAMRMAEALVMTPSGSKSPYFFDVARQFLAGLILHVLTEHPKTDHHLPFVRDLIIGGYKVFDDDGKELTQGDEAQELLLRNMAENRAFDGVIGGAVSAMLSAGGETAGNVRSTLQEQTKFLDIPNVRRVLKHSDISVSELKTRDDIVLAFTASIYSIREELSRLSRLLTNMIAYTFEAEKKKNGQCLMIVDELPSQGYNGTIEVLLAVARSMGITFVGVSQNIELMKKHYPNSYKSFISETDATFWMGGNHPDNAQLLSQLLGKKTIVDRDHYTGRKSYREVSVMEPEQIARYLDPNSDHLIVTRAGRRALKLRNDPYFKALPVTAYAPDPDHGDRLLRRITRMFLRP